MKGTVPVRSKPLGGFLFEDKNFLIDAKSKSLRTLINRPPKQYPMRLLGLMLR
jgi:hypothetical protein